MNKAFFYDMIATESVSGCEYALQKKIAEYIDSHREVSPLSRAADAYVLDNSDMTLHEETVWFQGLCQGKFGILE